MTNHSLLRSLKRPTAAVSDDAITLTTEAAPGQPLQLSDVTGIEPGWRLLLRDGSGIPSGFLQVQAVDGNRVTVTPKVERAVKAGARVLVFAPAPHKPKP